MPACRSASVEVTGFEVTDALAQVYRSGPVESRFVVAETLVVRTTDIDGIAKLAQRVGELIAAGRRAVQRGGRGLGSGLSVHRPERGQAGDGGRGHPQRPRKAPMQFAQDFGSRLGGIRSASQGVFQILARDEAPGLMEAYQINKRLRVVSTVEYFLAD